MKEEQFHGYIIVKITQDDTGKTLKKCLGLPSMVGLGPVIIVIKYFKQHPFHKEKERGGMQSQTALSTNSGSLTSVSLSLKQGNYSSYSLWLP